MNETTDYLAVLNAIEDLVSGDDVELLAMDAWADQSENADIDPKLKKLLAVYRLAHGYNPTHSCYGVHEGWRQLAKETK